MIITNDKIMAEKARYLTTQAKDDSVRYLHNEIGNNFLLTNIQAALGVAQLETLSKNIEKKEEIHHIYSRGLEEINRLKIAKVPNYANNNYWMNILQIEIDDNSTSLEKILNKLNNIGIQTRPVWFPNHMQKPYKNFQSYNIEKANILVSKSLCIPSSAGLNKKNIYKVISALKKING